MLKETESPGYRALSDTAAWLRLGERGLFAVSGEDRVRFMNAMLTGDMRGIAAGEGCYCLALDSRGRVLADAGVHVLENEVLLDTEPEAIDCLASHLDQHLIADDAELRLLHSQFRSLAVEGPCVEAMLSSIVKDLPVHPFGIVPLDGGWITRSSVTGLPGFRLWVPAADEDMWIGRLRSASIPAAAPEDFSLVRIENGKPRFGTEISSRFLGPEVNIAGSIATNKGCYLGQEVVERIRSRKLLARILVPVTLPASASVAPGVKLLAGDRRVGELLSIAYSPRRRALVGIASVILSMASPGAQLQCDSSGVCEVTVSSPGGLPYREPLEGV